MRSRSHTLALAACALLAPAASRAQLSLGVQAGAALPWGEAEAGSALANGAALAAPLELRAAWRVGSGIELGLQGGWAPAGQGRATSGTCGAAGTTCAGHLWRVAARGE